MAGDVRTAAHSLIERLGREPFRFDFFQAVRLIECANPDRPRVGCSRRLDEDPVRFGQEPSMAFAPSTLASCQAGADGGAPRLLVNFLGLLGPNGPMPLHITEYARARMLGDHDPTLARFLDVFHHRIIALFYRAWAIHHIPTSRDRPKEDRFAAYIGGLIGIGMKAMQRRDAVQDEAKLFYAGRLSSRTGNEEGLRAILGDYFNVPTRIGQFIGEWVALPQQYQLRMGESPETGTLGATTMVGERVWDCRRRFRISLGPMSLADYERFLPTGRSYRRLVDWVRNYSGGALAADLQLLLKAPAVPSIQLGALGQLGWSTWLTSKPLDHDAGDLVLLSIAA